MREITTRSELSDILFGELFASEPQYDVDAMFLRLLASDCFRAAQRCNDGGMQSWEQSLSFFWEGDGPPQCGGKLIEFGLMLAVMPCKYPSVEFSCDRLITIMIDTLESDYFEIRPVLDSELSEVVSSSKFESRFNLRIKTEIIHEYLPKGARRAANKRERARWRVDRQTRSEQLDS